MEKYVFITGSTDGIGKASVFEIMKKSRESIFFFIHGRNREKCSNVLNEFKSHSASEEHEFVCVIADFTDLSQVRMIPVFVEDVTDRIDVLINNAGVFMKNRVLTKDGFETTFQVNYLSHFLLTRILLPLLIESEEARIVNVSSMIHARSIDFSNLNGEKYYDGYEAYSLSKLANILFSNQLNDLLREKRISNVFTNSLHPGVIYTKLLHAGWGMGGNDPSEGGKRLAFLALSEKVKGISGKYFVNDNPVPPASIAEDDKTKKKLWEISSKFVKLPYELEI